MNLFHISLIVSTFLCSMAAGFLLAFALVVMPGIRNLGDKEFIKAFQVMDKIIQNGQPLFMVIWLGSVITLIISAIIGIKDLEGINLILMIISVLFFVAGVQLPTGMINVPLNNKLQTLNVNSLNENDHKKERVNFEQRWNKWNIIRTIFACSTSIILIFLTFSLTNVKL